MPRLPEPRIDTFRRRERDGAPVNDRRLARALDAGEFVRIAPGSFARAFDWRTLTPIEQHHLRVIEAADRAQGELIVMGAAAAAVHGIDRIGPWPRTIDIAVPRRGGGRSTGLMRRRGFSDLDLETVAWRNHRITTPAQTAIDVARECGYARGVVAMDQALWQRRPGGALTTIDDLTRVLTEGIRRRGQEQAERALCFASALADSVRESQSRVLLDQLGFPAPSLQQRFLLPGSRVVFSDFWWEEFAHVGEFDGVGKYFDPALLHGRTPEEAMLEEKDRADQLRRHVRALSRWRTPALRDVRELYDILCGDGLPSRLPRPPAGLQIGPAAW
ncbi:hypothetical protein [Microbacterium sp. bgisy203]|uniref:hypothetical protein n=1 Tax=Microbacterium sp. bgisy203 TaxID=3413799 RepID=UPI003D71809D